MAKVADQIRELAEPVVRALNLDLVDVEWAKEGQRKILRITIERPGERTGIDDCSAVSRALDEQLDALELEDYHLEVSSPGADRLLKTDADFNRFQGQFIKIKLFKPIQERRQLIGKLMGHDVQSITLDWEDQTLAVPRELVSQVRLVPEWDLPGKKGKAHEI